MYDTPVVVGMWYTHTVLKVDVVCGGVHLICVWM